jgi:hypothetical protein
MRSSLKVFAGVVIGASLMFLYDFVIGIQPWQSKLHLEILNQSSKPIKEVTVTTGQTFNPQQASFMKLVSGDKINYSRSFGGEGTCELHLEFEDGRKLNSQGMCVEGGYRLVYTLFDDTIHAE